MEVSQKLAKTFINFSHKRDNFSTAFSQKEDQLEVCYF